MQRALTCKTILITPKYGEWAPETVKLQLETTIRQWHHVCSWEGLCDLWSFRFECLSEGKQWRMHKNLYKQGKHVDAMLSYAVNPMFIRAVGFCGTLQCKYLHIANLNVCTGYKLTVDISGICNISAWVSQHPALPRCDWQLVWWSSTWCHLPRWKMLKAAIYLWFWHLAIENVAPWNP